MCLGSSLLGLYGRMSFYFQYREISERKVPRLLVSYNQIIRLRLRPNDFCFDMFLVHRLGVGASK